MPRRRLLAVAVMIAALIVILAGMQFFSCTTTSSTTQNVIFDQSLSVAVNGTGHLYVKLNGTQADYYVSLRVSNGSVRGAVLSKDEYSAWMNGSFKPQWQYDQPSTWWGGGEYCPMLSNAPQEHYYVFWNPDAPVNREVTLKICEQKTQTNLNYATIGEGLTLIAAGAVAGSFAAYKTGKRLFFTLITFTLILAGALLVSTYPKQFEGKETVATFSVTIPANSKIDEPLHYNTSDYYQLTITGPAGRLNTTIVAQSNYTDFLAGNYSLEYWQIWQGSHYPINGMPIGGAPDRNVRLVLVNPETFDEQATVQVDHVWIGTDYSGTIGGVTLIAFGIAALYFVHRRQIASFNRALENQE